MESDVRGWAVVFYALAFNYPHYMATVYRAYHTQSEFARYRIFTLHLTALLTIVALRRRGADARLVLACFLKSEEVLAATSDPQLQAVREVREGLEREHPEAATEVRNDLTAALAATGRPVVASQ